VEFSVWNYGTRQYDYYRAGQYLGTHVTQPAVHSLTGSQIGMTVDEIACSLPQGAQKVGSGEVAKGRIASTGAGLGNLLVYGVIAYILWRLFR